MSTRLALHPSMFGERERPLLALPGLECRTFRYASGVEGLRLANARGEIEVLPYRGQQVWRARFDGRPLTMRSMFDEPSHSTDYLRTYGAFFIHCGLAGLGAPGPDDTHPLHGELPNAPFDEAWLDIDETAGTLEVGGSYRHTVAFSTDYRATASVRLARDSALLDVALAVENLKRTPMPLMYLAHANFRPVDGAELAYSARYTPESVRVRRSVPSHISPPPGYAELLASLAREPSRHHRLNAGERYDPEVVFSIDMLADDDGWAHALQRLPDSSADYLTHRPDEAPLTVRWICRTPDQDALGLAFPATSGVEGYQAERAAGRVVTLPGGETWRIGLRLGALTPAEAADVARRIERVAGRA